jgi:hypothetical protein
MAKSKKAPPKDLAVSPTQVETWVDAPNGYKLSIVNGKVVCKNAKGTLLASVPATLKEDPITDQLQALVSWLDEHHLECLHTVERWMLRSLVIPSQTLLEVWRDPDWKSAMTNLAIAPADISGKVDTESIGLLKDADPQRGLGIVDVDGESKWLNSPNVAFVHPILIGELDELRELATDLAIMQPIEQLYRPVFAPTPNQLSLSAILDYQGGEFEQLNYALGHCKRLGYPVRGGYAICKVWEGQSPLEARFYIGSEHPESQTFTGDLIFVNANQQAVPVRDVGPVTFSEGIRMATAIYAKRKVEKQEGGEA